MRFLISCFFLLLGFHLAGFAQPLRVAVAANAQFVIKPLQKDFQKKTKLQIEIITGSSGKLTAQIKNGAPYDVFLSADMEYPTNLFKAGFGLSAPKVYALGSLIVCSTSEVAIQNWQQLLLSPSITKIALANPELAPYGRATQEAMRQYGLWDKVHPKLIFGESIAQVNTYITTGAVKLGFTSEALIYENSTKHKFKWARIDPKAYSTIEQGMVVLSHAKKGNYSKAMQFYHYLSSPAAKQILRQNGYRVL
ncbi:molybdate ABC transporter substrate-binding protein [Adhaeribacter radiodurans]|uniref:Molybdate ABC transporter substrate-binding protein n=1 Tax=Adhaeribacter radiodurans TaxID=2745197 RepID=A0A7L7L629_9BACT|nr:molybdate ABC transporter substrate-binding protein [Adhaeribacter radiodurans]QMU28214.1 molybdate ABC transporter substrate-binding protein [Adhaeribacter radiodurans]